ncbi:MAG: SDR family oxidoreductase [Bacteroidota bacterium]
MKQGKLINQTCIVTGGSSGIGRAIAIAIGNAGANVIVNYHSDQEGAKEVVQAIEAADLGNKAIVFQADVSKEKEVEAMFKETIEHFETVDILIANAGIQQDAPLHEMTTDQWQKVIDVNLTGQFFCVRAALQEFLRRGMRAEVSKALGKIIHISSVHEVIPWSGHANYAAAKGGIEMLMKSLAQGYGKQKIRVNSIAPGAIKTPINKEAWSNPEKLNKLLKLIPYNRIGEPSDIGEVSVWLASDESDYITGASIFVDGGMTCYPGFIDNG